LTLNGSGFLSDSQVKLNGEDRATTYVSATQLTAQILATDVASLGTANINVVNPPSAGGGGGLSNTLGLAIGQPANPVPVLATLAPSQAAQGSGALALTLTGTNFLASTIVRWQGLERVTTFVNATQLTAQLTANDLATAGTFNVTVLNPAPGGGGSNALPFTVVAPPNPMPALASINPTRVTVGGAAFTLTVTGTNFINASTIRWNGADRATTFISATQLSAQIPASDIATLGTQQGVIAIAVFNPPTNGGGGGSSNFIGLSLVNPVPTLNGLSPNNAIAGSAALTLSVNGSGFVNGAIVQWAGSARATTFVSANRLTVHITADDLLTVRNVNVTVVNPAPGGGASNPSTFAVSPPPNPVPVLVSMNPNAIAAGSAALTLTLNGNGFVNGAVARWNGTNRQTSFVSQTQLTAQIPANDLASVGSATVTVFNPASINGGGGVSNGLTFTINQTPNPLPTLTSIAPNLVVARGPAFTLALTGNNFLPNSVVRWNDADRATTFVSATQLTAEIPGTDLRTDAGSAQIRVVNPPSSGGGGGASAALAITIAAPLANVSAASYRANEIARGSITAAFGVNLAARTEVARTNPLPTELLGTRISIRDSAGNTRLAPLFFVSPTQVNYFLPSETAPGQATVSLTNGAGQLSLGTVTVANVAPGLFTANANGAGVPAAVILRVKGDGTFGYETLATFNQQSSQWMATPIDLGPESDQVFLVLYGTGFTFRQSLANGAPANVTATIGGVAAQVLFAGGQGGLLGVDQANVLLSRTLRGRGEVEAILTVDGKTTNTVKISIR
jgi:uncharacterized protein (TIGR03437 family)